MNRIMLIIEYMNAIYALKKQDNNCYPATSSFCIEYSVVIVVYTIRYSSAGALVGSFKGVLHCTLVHYRGGSRISIQGGAHLKKLRRAEKGAKIVGVSRVKNHILRQQIIFFFQFQGGLGSAPALLEGLIMQARIQDFRLEDNLHRRTFIICFFLFCFFCFLFF